MAIERLSLIDEVNASTYFAVNVNNQDYRAGAKTVADYVASTLTPATPTPFVPSTIQYSSPPGPDFTFTLTNDGVSTWLALTPITGITSGTVVLPNVVNCEPSQQVLITTTQSIASFAINANGASVIGAPTSLEQNECFTIKFEPLMKIWYRVASDWQLNTFSFGTY
jgi:hypothetical protein